jgi:hypothetical protein
MQYTFVQRLPSHEPFFDVLVKDPFPPNESPYRPFPPSSCKFGPTTIPPVCPLAVFSLSPSIAYPTARAISSNSQLFSHPLLTVTFALELPQF